MAENDARPEALRSVAPSLKPPALARARTGLALRGVARHGPVHPYLPRYSVEEPRGSFIPNVTAHDLWETYLAQCAAVPAQPLGHILAAWQLSARVCAWLEVWCPNLQRAALRRQEQTTTCNTIQRTCNTIQRPTARRGDRYELGFSAKDSDGTPAGHAMGTMCRCGHAPRRPGRPSRH
jgi:hypothetical protein